MHSRGAIMLVAGLAVILTIGIYYSVYHTPTDKNTETASNITTTTRTTSNVDTADNETISNGSRYGVVEIIIEGTAESRLNVIVSFEYPGVSRDFFFKVEELPARLTINFSKELTEAEEMHEKLKEALAKQGYSPERGSQPLPTINIRIMYEEGGETRSILVLYDALKYYNETERKKELESQGLTSAEAALEDPFKPFREGVTIKINIDELRAPG